MNDLSSIGANAYSLDICYPGTDINNKLIKQSVLVEESSFLKVKTLSKDLENGIDYVLSVFLLCCIDYDYDTNVFLPEQPKKTIINAINMLKKGGQARFYWSYHIGGVTFSHISGEPYDTEKRYYTDYNKIMQSIVELKPNIKYLLMYDTDLLYGISLIVINE